MKCGLHQRRRPGDEVIANAFEDIHPLVCVVHTYADRINIKQARTKTCCKRNKGNTAGQRIEGIIARILVHRFFEQHEFIVP